MAEEKSAYFQALKSQKIKPVKMSISQTRQAMINQEKRCFKCKKELKPYYYKFEADPATREVRVICSDCAIEMK